MASICGSLSSLPIILALLIYLLAYNKVEAGDLEFESEDYKHYVPTSAEKSAISDCNKKIFSIGGEPLQPDETYSLLQKLDALYEPFTDKQIDEEKNYLKKLIKARDSVRNCDGQYLRDFHYLIEIHTLYEQTLIPYLNDAIKRYRDSCEEKLRSDLHSNVENMRPESHEDIETLTEIFLQIYYGSDKVREDTRHISVSNSQLVEGVLLFLKHKNSDLFTDKGSVDFRKFDKIFDQQIVELCRSWRDITEPMAYYGNWDRLVKFNELETRWLTYWRICYLILTDIRLLKAEAFEEFKRRTSRLSKASASLQRHVKKLNCFGQTSATC